MKEISGKTTNGDGCGWKEEDDCSLGCDFVKRWQQFTTVWMVFHVDFLSLIFGKASKRKQEVLKLSQWKLIM